MDKKTESLIRSSPSVISGSITHSENRPCTDSDNGNGTFTSDKRNTEVHPSIALIRLKESDLLTTILEHYFEEAPQDHETNQQIFKLEFTNLICQAAVTDNAEAAKTLWHTYDLSTTTRTGRANSSPQLFETLLASALRDDDAMIDALLSSLETNTAQQEATKLIQKLSLAIPQQAVVRNYLKRRYCKLSRVSVSPLELRDPIERSRSAKSRKF